jgi:hypothetical protein
MDKRSSRFRRASLLVLILILLSCVCVRPERPPLTFSPEELPHGRVGEPYYVEIQPDNNVTPVYHYDFTGTVLPKGMEFTWKDTLPKAVLEGVPEEAGTFTIVVSALCLGTSVSGQGGSKQYTLVIDEN